MNVEISIRSGQKAAASSAFSSASRAAFPLAVAVPDLGIEQAVALDLATLRETLGAPNTRALDFLLLAGAVYVIDKSVPRRLAPDRWTREFALTVPVAEPAAWMAAREPLTRALAFLTGDVWFLTFVSRPELPQLSLPLQPAGRQRHGAHGAREDWPVKEAEIVTLFSGGLDSLVGALDALADSATPAISKSGDSKVLLVGHGDATSVLGDQHRVYNGLVATPLSTRLRWVKMRIGPVASAQAPAGLAIREPYGRETTLRSRSLVFLALGLCAAQACGPEVPLLVPENGFIALNPPLTPSRLGSCSTRTTHPYFLSEVRQVAAALGLSTPIRDPYRLRTKGELLDGCHDRETLAQLAPDTVSSAHATRRGRWRRRGARNCGYCVPCLIRRAALHAIGCDDGMAYGIDVGASELDLARDDIAADLRALMACLRETRSAMDIARRARMTGPIPREDRAALVAMLDRGFDELRVWVRDHGSPAMREWADVR